MDYSANVILVIIFVGIYEYFLNDDHGVLIRLFESCAYCGMPRLGAFYGYLFCVDHDVFFFRSFSL